MKSKIWVAAAMGLLAASLFATVATAQCTPAPNYPGVMIKFDGDAWSYETNYSTATLISQPASQLTVVGRVSVFCSPFADLDPADPNTDYTFIWDGLASLGTTTRTVGSSGMAYTTKYVGGGFRIYAGSPRNAPTAATLPALPAPGVVPDAFVDGTMILGGGMDTLVVIVTRASTGNYTGSFRANYWATGGTRFDQVGDAGNLLSGAWCAVPPGTSFPIGTCSLPTGWSAHPNGKWDTPITVPALPSTWGKIKTLYR
jgi:hypothetical protein